MARHTTREHPYKNYKNNESQRLNSDDFYSQLTVQVEKFGFKNFYKLFVIERGRNQAVIEK
jgi:plasmid rolling circle replication initiator protein Rep